MIFKGIKRVLTVGTFMTAMLVVAVTFSVTALAQQVTLTSTVPQSGFFGFSSPFPLTGPQPYTFSEQEVASCASIESISVTLTLNDGDTAPGEFDFNDLFLALDGIDTGIALNGFPDAQTVTLTITGTPQDAAAILAALQADNQLVGTIIDIDPGENFVGIPAEFNTTLDITCTTQEVPPEQQPNQQQPNQQQPNQQQPNQQQPNQQQPNQQGGPAPITQETEQDSESGEIDQSFEVS